VNNSCVVLDDDLRCSNLVNWSFEYLGSISVQQFRSTGGFWIRFTLLRHLIKIVDLWSDCDWEFKKY